jgi:hypothetical protein
MDAISLMKALNPTESFTRKFFLILLVVLSGISVCSAQLPMNQMQGDITYISGGIGEDESRAIKAESKNWPLSIEFSEYVVSQDLWVAQVYLRILDSKGKTILETIVDGPMFLGRLPPDTYELFATYEGVTKSRKIQIVNGKTLHISMSWRLYKSEI